MRTLSMWAVAGGLLSLGALAGCGGSSGNNGGASTANRDAPVIQSQVEYTVTDLGATDYYYSNYGYINNRYRYNGVLRINDAGQIITNTTDQPVLYDGQPHSLKGAVYGTASGINNHGVVVGSSYYQQNGGFGGILLATQWRAGDATPIDAGSAGTWSVAYAVNDAGAAVGESTQGMTGWYVSPSQATLWQNGQKTVLGSLGGDYSLGYAINASGVVVGWSQLTPATDNSSYNYAAPVHAFVWTGGTMTDLGVLPGGVSSDAQAINDIGLIVGSSETAAQGLYSYRALHAVAWTNGTLADLGTIGGPGSIAYGLNNAGVIVGSSDTHVLAPQSPYYGWYYTGSGAGTGGGSGGSSNAPPLAGGAGGRSIARTRGIGDTYVSHAFRYSGGKMEDLNSLIDAASGWELLTATAINNQGQIVGFGKFGNRQHAFLLTPK